MSRIGTILFASVTLLTLSSSNSIFSSHILKPFSSMFNLRRRKISSQNAGDLIVHGTSRWESNFWKFLSSSSSDNHDCDVEVVNNSNEVVIFCWVDFDGALHHFSPINDRSIRDGSVSNRHVESTATNHVFVCMKSTSSLPRHVSDIDPHNFIFSFRPTLRSCRHRVELKQNKRSGKFEVSLRCELTTAEDEEVVDTSDKVYLTREICGFTIHYEPGVFDCTPQLEACVADDLRFVCLLLPEAARMKLQASTPFWLNTNISYGPKRKPIIGRTACFHPGAGWLKKMGMNPAKCGGVEIYSAADYVGARPMWGTGGLLLHELCHAYHFKHCPDGYDCVAIRDVRILS